MQKEESSDDLGGAFQNDDQVNAIISQNNDSHPTRQKVRVFKNRVFALLMLYVDKTKNLSPLLQALNQQVFIKEPKRMRELLSSLANKGNLSLKMLHQIAEYYKIMLLFKLKNDIEKYSEDFVKILRRLRSEDETIAKKIIQQMVEIYLLKRKCHLQFSFFLFVLRKLPIFKSDIVEKLIQIQSKNDLRPAQIKQIQKLKKKFCKKQYVKEQQVAE